jgi:two-component sensor histidine kinase/sensor domain CHASE-containing protein
MGLRLKAIAILSGTLIGLCLLLGGILSLLTFSGYGRLERLSAERELGRAMKGLAEDGRRVASISGDWAPWDETYNFALGRDPRYVENNLTGDAFVNLNLNLVAIVDNQGKALLIRYFDLGSKVFRDFPPEFQSPDLLEPLLIHADLRSGTDGIMKIGGDRLMLVASRPITTSDLSARPVGSLIMGLMVDAREASILSERLSIDLTIARIDEGQSPGATSGLLARLSSPGSTYILPQSSDVVVGYSLLSDIHGKPAALLKVSLPRSIYKEGLASLLYVFVAFAILALVSTLAVILIVDRLILRRLSHLGREIERVGTTHDLAVRIRMDGSDELASLASVTNSTLSALDDANRALRSSLDEKTALLREIHNRVKNNLQLVSSLLYLHSDFLPEGEASEALRESQNRIDSMALIHELLYRSEDGGLVDLAHVEFRNYLRKLSEHLADMYRVDSKRVAIRVVGDQTVLDADTSITCALIANELMSNALKHAFPEGREGGIEVSIGRDAGGRVTFSVKDDGIGLPPDFAASSAESLGFTLIKNLTSQLHGTLTLRPAPGCEVTISFLRA